MANISIGSGVFDVIFGLLSRGLKLKREEKIRREWRKLDGKITRIEDTNGRSIGGPSGRPGPYTYHVEAFDPLTNSTRSFPSEKKHQQLQIGAPVSVYVNPQLRWSSFVDISDLPALDLDAVNKVPAILEKIAKSGAFTPPPKATDAPPEQQPDQLNPDLMKYVQDSLDQDERLDIIRAKLIAIGWDKKVVEQAIEQGVTQFSARNQAGS